MSASFWIEIEPIGRRVECWEGESLFTCARRLGLELNSVCGGQGTCHSCRVQVLNGTVSEPTGSELETFTLQELQEGWRLACQTYPRSNCRLYLPPESLSAAQRIQLEGMAIAIQPEPPVKAHHLRLKAPSLPAPQADADHLLQELDSQHGLHCKQIDITVLRLLPEQLRAWNWECQAIVRGSEVIALAPLKGRQLGLAVDLGTTKIAGYLVDLNSGETLAARGVMNPQISYGEDVVSRINAAAQSAEASREQQRLVVEALNELGRDLCAEVDAWLGEVLEMVAVGNTAMHHLFLGLPAKQLALSPFVPAVSQALDIKARDLGLETAPGAYVHLLPNIAGFIGSDHVAMLLATGAWQAEGPVLALLSGERPATCATSSAVGSRPYCWTSP